MKALDNRYIMARRYITVIAFLLVGGIVTKNKAFSSTDALVYDDYNMSREKTQCHWAVPLTTGFSFADKAYRSKENMRWNKQGETFDSFTLDRQKW